jgi:glucose/arabinose dehydrogenase
MALILTSGTAVGCNRPADSARSNTSAYPAGATVGTAGEDRRPVCDADNGGLKLPEGFCAAVFADNLGHARHIAVAPGGDVYVNTWSSKYNEMRNPPGGFVVALRDADRDGRAELVQRFGSVYQAGKPGGGSGIAVHDGWLYVEVDDRIVRYRLNALEPQGKPETVLSGFQMDGDHPMHTFAIGTDGSLFVNSGSASNACQEKNRQPKSPGMNRCPELETRSGIWRYDANRPGQSFSPRERLATGTRNAVALAVAPGGDLYAAMHGRDHLSSNWPDLYTQEQQNELPAEIFARIEAGQDFGWPTCYFDAAQGKHVLAPEYGGDGGKALGDCGMKTMPLLTFPAHWAPEAMAFYGGSSFPEKYRNGAFVTFHGSHDRKPVQSGFLVAFVPFADGKPSGSYEEFATGFAGSQAPADPKKAPHRPMGVAAGPDGAIYVTDDAGGRVWRVVYKGK